MMDDLEEYKWKEIEDLSRGEKLKRYEWRMKFMWGCIEGWFRQMSEPEKYGTFNDWERCDNNGRMLPSLMEEMISLACEVDPESVPKFQNMKENIINIRIANYEIMRKIHCVPDPPLPTPQEEAAAEAEKKLAYETRGLNLLRKDGLDP